MELRFLQRSSELLGVPNPSWAISLAVIALVLSSLPWSRMTGTRILVVIGPYGDHAVVVLEVAWSNSLYCVV